MDNNKIGPLTNDLNGNITDLPAEQAANGDAGILVNDTNANAVILKTTQVAASEVGHLACDLNSNLVVVKSVELATKACGKAIEQEGGNAHTEHLHDMGDVEGSVSIYYDMRDKSESLDVYYIHADNTEEWVAGTGETVPPPYGYTTGIGCVTFYYFPDPNAYQIKVVIDTETGSDTDWWYIVNCPTGACTKTLNNNETKTFTVLPGGTCSACDYTLDVCGCTAPSRATGQTWLEKVTLVSFTKPSSDWKLESWSNYQYEVGKTYRTPPPLYGFYSCDNNPQMSNVALHEPVAGEVVWQQSVNGDIDYPLHNIFFRMSYNPSSGITGNPAATVRLKCELQQIKVAYLVTTDVDSSFPLTQYAMFNITIQAVIKGTTTPITDYVPSGNVNLIVCNTNAARTTDPTNVLNVTTVDNTGWVGGAKTISNFFKTVSVTTLAPTIQRYIGAHGPVYVIDPLPNQNQNIGVEAGETLVTIKKLTTVPPEHDLARIWVGQGSMIGYVSSDAFRDYGSWEVAYMETSQLYDAGWRHVPPQETYNPHPYCHEEMFGGGGVPGWFPTMFDGSWTNSPQNVFNNTTAISGAPNARLNANAITGAVFGGTGYYDFRVTGSVRAGTCEFIWPTTPAKSGITSVWLLINPGYSNYYVPEEGANIFINACILPLDPSYDITYGADFYSLPSNVGRWNIEWLVNNTGSRTYVRVPGITGASNIIANYVGCRVFCWFSYWNPNPYLYDYPCPDPTPDYQYDYRQTTATCTVGWGTQGMIVTY